MILNPVSSALCMQYTIPYYIVMFSCLVMLRYNLQDSDKYWYYFFVIGICSGFFELLEYPMITMGIPLILFIVLNNEKWFSKSRKVVISSCCWGLGFACMWCGKWCVATLITDRNYFVDVYEQIKFRLGGTIPWDTEMPITIAQAFDSNFYVFRNNVIIAVGVLLLLSVIYFIIHRKRYNIKLDVAILVPLLWVSTYPFIWYSVLRQHSIIHAWMTHRLIAVTVLALIYAVVYSFIERKPKRKSKTIRKKLTPPEKMIENSINDRK